jgi:hypothetical protein
LRASLSMERPARTLAYDAAKERGIDVASLPEAVEEAVEVRPAGAGVGSVEVIFAGLLAKMAYDAWKDVWNGVLFPKIKKKFGEGAIVPIDLGGDDKPAKKDD